MRFSVKAGTMEEFNNSIPRPECGVSGYRDYYTGILEKACTEKKELISLKGLSLNDRPSTDFQYMGIMEQTIMSFLQNNEFPRNVQIICDSEECATRYKVVYNFYYATDKTSRMADKSWD